MGSRGAFLESGGFSAPARWTTVGYVEGIKVLEPKDSKASRKLPMYSKTPGTAYLLYRKDGTFDQLRVFGSDRKPRFDIDYGVHSSRKTLHIHFYKNGIRSKSPVMLHPGDTLYEKYKNYLRG